MNSFYNRHLKYQMIVAALTPFDWQIDLEIDKNRFAFCLGPFTFSIENIHPEILLQRFTEED